MVNDQKDKLYNNPEASNRTNRFQTQLMIERGNPLIEPIETGQPVVGTIKRTVQDGRTTSFSQEIDTLSVHEEAVKTDRTGQPVVETGRTQTRSSVPTLKRLMIERGTRYWNKHRKCARNFPNTFFSWKHKVQRWRRNNSWSNGVTVMYTSDESSHEQTMLNGVNIDFRFPGLPHSFVKQAESSRVRELVKKSRTT